MLVELKRRLREVKTPGASTRWFLPLPFPHGVTSFRSGENRKTLPSVITVTKLTSGN
jgi:hypothetical protein